MINPILRFFWDWEEPPPMEGLGWHPEIYKPYIEEWEIIPYY